MPVSDGNLVVTYNSSSTPYVYYSYDAYSSPNLEINNAKPYGTKISFPELTAIEKRLAALEYTSKKALDYLDRQPLPNER